MKGLLAIVAVSGLAGPATVATAQGTQPRNFEPSSPWAMEYAESSCKLVRNFSDGKEEITLALERTEPGYNLAAGLAGSPLKTWRNAKEAAVAFGPGGGEQDRPLMSSRLADGRTYYVINPVSLVPSPDFSRMSPADAMKAMGTPPSPERELATAGTLSTLAVTKGFTEPVELQLGPMAAPMKAMQSCTDDLLTQWGLDAQAHRTLSRPAIPLNMDKLSKSFQFPMRAWRDGREGFVQFRLKVDAEGKPTDCVIVAAPGAQEFSDAACRALLGEWRFAPALDAQGKPIASYHSNRVFFSAAV